MNITVIGGHGKIALLLEPLLVGAGHEVEAVIRNPDHTAEVEATGAHARVADIEQLDPAGWESLLRGTDVVIWSAGAGGGNPARTRAVDRDGAIASVDAASKVGAGRYVMVSYFGAGLDHGVPEDDSFYPYAQAKAEADAHLEATGVDHVIVKPSALTLEDPTGSIDVSATESGQVSRANVARVIAEAVGRDDLRGVSIAFNDGSTPIPEALDEIAAR